MENAKTILIVDDDETIRFTIASLLEDDNFRVIEAENAQTALEMIKTAKPDLITLDHHMPGMSGVEFLSLLRNMDRRIPVIMVTANPTQTVSVQALREGADDFVAKPFDNDILLLVIRRTLEHRIQRRKLHDETVARKAVEEASKLKSRFLANMGHETATRIHQTIGFVDLSLASLKKGDLFKTQSHLGVARDSVLGLQDLVQRIALLSSLQSADEPLQISMQRLNLHMESVLDLVQEKAAKKAVQLKTEFPTIIQANVDGNLIRRVFAELIENALSVAPSGSRIAISGVQEKGRVIIDIQDSGCGIPEAEWSSVFNPFELSSRTDTGADGKGVGLALVKLIMEKHGGSVAIKESSEHGTIIRLDLKQ